MTAQQVFTVIKNQFGIELIDYKCTSREMYFVDTKTGRATYNNALPSANERLNMSLNTTFTSCVVNIDGSVTLERSMRYSGKNYKIRTILDYGDGHITMSNYMELFAVLIAQKESTNTASINQARTKFNMPNDPVVDVIQAMSTAVSIYSFDPYQYAPGELDIKISVLEGTKQGRVKIKGELTRNGQVVPHEKIRWEVWPGIAPQGVPNTTTNRNVSAQFPTSPEFEITTDLRDRKAYPIMGGGEVRFVCMATTSESDGDKVQVLVEKIVSLPFAVYNYFGS